MSFNVSTTYDVRHLVSHLGRRIIDAEPRQRSRSNLLLPHPSTEASTETSWTGYYSKTRCLACVQVNKRGNKCTENLVNFMCVWFLRYFINILCQYINILCCQKIQDGGRFLLLCVRTDRQADTLITVLYSPTEAE